jgi:Glycosyl transferases group 1
MRKLYFLLPGTGSRFACGGLWAELKTLALTQQICAAEIVTYRQREAENLFLPDLLKQIDRAELEQAIFVLSWGFDVPHLAAKLKPYHLIYHAHSANYGFKLPASIPILAVSRHTMGYWGQRSPHALIYYLPNQISDQFQDLQVDRDLDVLVQARKSSEYLLQELVPALQPHCRVQVLDSHVADLSVLFNRAKVYLYDSAEYWAQQGGITEGFGLQPMEAMACGCQVFSSVNGGLSDYLDPGFNCQKIAGYSREYDQHRILQQIRSPSRSSLPNTLLEEYRTKNIVARLAVIVDEINTFFDYKSRSQMVIKELTKIRLTQLLINKTLSKVKKKLFK